MLAGAVLAVSGVARADRGDPAELAAPFATLDHLDGASVVNLQLTYPATKSTTPFVDSNTILAFELDARYVDPASHIGGYLSVPLDYIGGSSTPIGDTKSVTAFGGVELGALYALATSKPGLGVILHAGLVLPTASKDNALANIVALEIVRPRDLAQGVPGFSLRLGASPIIRHGAVFARGDLDLDVNLSNSAGDTAKPVLNIGGGVGVQTSAVALTAELGITHSFDDNAGSHSTRVDLALAVRLTQGTIHPYVALVLPLDSDSRNLADFAVTGGVAGSIR